MPNFCRLLFLICALGFASAALAADPYDETLEKHFATQDQGTNKESNRVEADPGMSPEQAKVAAIERTIVEQTRTLAAGPPVTPPPPVTHHHTLAWALALLLGAGLALWRISERMNPWKSSATAKARAASALRAEDEAFAKFTESFKVGLASRTSDAPAPTAVPQENDPVKIFYAEAPELFEQMSRVLSAIPSTTGETRRQSQLVELHGYLSALRGDVAARPELLPVCQMTAAVEGLVKQLIDQASNVTPSTLRTVAGGVAMLQKLCQPGVRTDILSNPPLRLLAVDDDPICRLAISSALKKALCQPDLAENGESALALATERAYDVIFLDVQMPGMDGFEICTKIHATTPNAATPTVFVTILNDFEARTQSVLKGGSDLISKPFLTFEITVKALTFILQGRLRAPVQTAGANRSLDETRLPSRLPIDPSPAPNGFKKSGVDSAVEIPPKNAAAAHRQVVPPDHRHSMVSDDNSPQDITDAFLTRASTQIGELRELIQTASQTKDEAVRLDALGNIYLRINSMMPPAGMATEHPALRLSMALEGLLKKLLLDNKFVTPSSLQTITAAAELLQELCSVPVKADLASNPPIHILTVDDDLVSLRAITSALQMMFAKPETAESGEAALILAEERPFDVIFIDVQMPGMDGFSACSRIHETVPNSSTPMVFVTSHDDLETRSKADVSGGRDFITKPFLTAEITVKAITYALRGRLQNNPVVAELMDTLENS